MTPFDPTTRAFLKSALALSAGATVLPARAQGKAPIAGTDYRTLNPAQPTESGNKIELIEFFWYGCPHCYGLEPVLRDWLKKLPPDVAFRKLHVPFNEVKHQQLYYTLETLGKGDSLDEMVFAGIHVERNRLDTPEKQADFLAKAGVDKKAFADAFGSFSVQTKMRKATAIASAFKIDSVPMLGVNGKYLTSPSMAGSNGNALGVVEYLIEQERKARK
jgi:thiol:disulfide interchange protein DsbA